MSQVGDRGSGFEADSAPARRDDGFPPGGVHLKEAPADKVQLCRASHAALAFTALANPFTHARMVSTQLSTLTTQPARRVLMPLSHALTACIYSTSQVGDRGSGFEAPAEAAPTEPPPPKAAAPAVTTAPQTPPDPVVGQRVRHLDGWSGVIDSVLLVPGPRGSFWSICVKKDGQRDPSGHIRWSADFSVLPASVPPHVAPSQRVVPGAGRGRVASVATAPAVAARVEDSAPAAVRS